MKKNMPAVTETPKERVGRSLEPKGFQRARWEAK